MSNFYTESKIIKIISQSITKHDIPYKTLS